MKTNGIILFGLTAIITLGGSAPAAANDNMAFAAVSPEAATMPVGHAEFCQRRPGECLPHRELRDRVALTPAKWEELQAVNNHYNLTITPVSDQDLYGVAEFWTYPTSGFGDCEDIALAKRAALIERGWHPSTLLMTVVMQENGEGHAVLMARTDRGDLILDNQEALIKVWTDTPYTYLKRQSQAHAGQWVDILAPHTSVPVVATAGY